MKIASFAAGMLALACATPLTAQVRPQPGSGDPHIQSVDYDPNQVVLLQTAPGYELTVGLAADEQIESVAVGDGAAFQVSASHSGDHLFIKALQGNAATNMTVVTTTRAYAFDLVALDSPSPAMPYSVQFTYPSPATAQPGDATTAAVAKADGQYVLHGDHALRPAGMTDDGVHTYIQWPADAPLPATYFRDDNGKETLANGEMRDGLYVIDSVHQHLIFRIDKHDARADRVIPRADD